jgi:hypothetical protein
VRGNVSTKWAPAAIAAREENELLVSGILLLIDMQMERWATADCRLKSSVLYFVRQFFGCNVVIKTVIPPHCVHRSCTND